MKLSEILDPENIIPKIVGKDKPAVLKELCEFLKSKGVIRNHEELLGSLLNREQLGSTGIGENVGIPHAKSDEIEKIIAVFGKSEEGIEFESLDEKPVHFLCLLLAPAQSTGLHLKALAKIARLLKSQSVRDQILKATDAKTIFSILQDEDSKFI